MPSPPVPMRRMLGGTGTVLGGVKSTESSGGVVDSRVPNARA